MWSVRQHGGQRFEVCGIGALQQQLGDLVFGRLHVYKFANLGMILEHNTEHHAAIR